MLAVLSALVCASGLASPVSVEQARTAIGNWLRSGVSPGTHRGREIASVRTCTPDNGAVFHVARISGGGFVVTGADTRIEPVIAFSDAGDLVEDDGNPLWVLLKGDLAARQGAVARTGRKMSAAAGAVREGTGGTGSGAEALWASLLAMPAADGQAGRGRILSASAGRSKLSDVRVEPLLGTEWSQTDYRNQGSFSADQACYNYYTPNHWPCGCVATVGAQIMRYFRHPEEPVSAGTYFCGVFTGVYAPRWLTMMGGTYAWDLMPDVPARGCTAAQREAIGHLTYDVGVSCGMQYGEDGSSAPVYMLVRRLVDRFGYSNAVGVTFAANGFYDGGDFGYTLERLKSAAIPCLDAGLPVALGISGDKGGHAVVGDGYGYANGNFYLHVNLGWANLDGGNAWYMPPDIDDFDTIDTVVYNIYPTQAAGASIVSGRVLDESGNPVVGARVTAAGAADESDAQGVYALIVPAGTHAVVAEKDGKSATAEATAANCVSTRYHDNGDYSSSDRPAIGNVHGIDLTLAAAAEPPEPQDGEIAFDDIAYASPIEARDAAVASERLLFVLSGADWCPWTAVVKDYIESLGKAFTDAFVLYYCNVDTDTFGMADGVPSYGVFDPVKFRTNWQDGLLAYDSGGVSEFVQRVLDKGYEAYVTDDSDFGKGLDAPQLVWTSGGTYPWKLDVVNSHDGVSSARSGDIPFGTGGVQSWMQTTMQGPTLMSFRYRKLMASSRFRVLCDSQEVFCDSEDSTYWGSDWILGTADIPAGIHTVRFEFDKGWSYFPGALNGVWLDEIGFDLLSHPPSVRPYSALDDTESIVFTGSMEVELRPPEGLEGTVFYTLDGGDPTSSGGKVYESPITLTSSALLQAVFVEPGREPSMVRKWRYIERHPVVPGEWTTDARGVRAALRNRGGLACVLCSHGETCGFSRMLWEVIERPEFLSWAREHDVYLVTSDKERDPGLSSGTSEANDWDNVLYAALTTRPQYIEWPMLTVAYWNDLDRPAGFGLIRPGEEFGGKTYDGTVDSLIACLSRYLDECPAPPPAEQDEIPVEDAYGPYPVGVIVCEELGEAVAGCKASGLPSGLKFATKQVKDKVCGTVPAWTVYGVPTKAGTYTVVFTKKVGKVTHRASSTIVVTALPAWAVGTFNGGGAKGQVSLTVGKTGRISGKYLADGKSRSLSAASFSYQTEGDAYLADVVMKAGSVKETLELTLVPDESFGGVVFCDDSQGELFTARLNRWKDAAWKAVGKMIANRALTLASGVELKFAANGTAKAAYREGKKTYSGSAVLVTVGEPSAAGFDGEVWVYIPPKKGAFDGWCEQATVRWDGTAFAEAE